MGARFYTCEAPLHPVAREEWEWATHMSLLDTSSLSKDDDVGHMLGDPASLVDPVVEHPMNQPHESDGIIQCLLGRCIRNKCAGANCNIPRRSNAIGPTVQPVGPNNVRASFPARSVLQNTDLVSIQSSRCSIVLVSIAVLKVVDSRVNVFGGAAAGKRAQHGALILDGGGVLRKTRLGRRVVSLKRICEPVAARRTTDDLLGRGGGANLRRRSVAVDGRRWCLAEHQLRATGRVVEGLEPSGACIVLVVVGVRAPWGDAVSLSCRIRRRRSLDFEVPLDHGGRVLVVACSSKNDASTQMKDSFEPNHLVQREIFFPRDLVTSDPDLQQN